MTTRDTAMIAPPAPPQEVFSIETFELLVAEGADAGVKKTFAQQSVQVGTARSNDLVLSDRTVSRFHMRIENRSGRFSVIDMGSTNGTLVDGLSVEVANLHGDASIRIGNTLVHFHVLADHATVRRPRIDHFGPVVGKSPRMRQLYHVIELAAGSDMPIIIEGETGTGKELVARLLHDRSPRTAGPFEILDCQAVPDNLLESELFGHVRGAFTGAERNRTGVFERAHGGTVFIDEIGEIKPELQPKLLRVLETGQMRQVGGNRMIDVDVRVVAATNRSLTRMINSGQFREDLYFRLAGCKIELPPLRERSEDIPLLADHFLNALRKDHKDVPALIAPEIIEQLKAQRWPGNVRQLKSAVAHIALLAPGAKWLDTSKLASDPDARATDASLKAAREDFERRYLLELLSRFDGDIDAAAAAAKMHPKSLTRLLRRHRIGHA